jgi:hypothetical protein
MKTTVRVLLGLVLAFPVGSARGQAPDPPPLSLSKPKTYGTGQDSISHVPVTAFSPFDGSWETRDYSIPGTIARYTTNCSGNCMYAIPRLPDGALLTGIEAYFCNTDPNPIDYLGININKTIYDGTDIVPIAGAYSATHSGCGESVFTDLTSLNYTVNPYNNQLFLETTISAADGSQAIAGVNLYYRLQVSPAPPTADFADVPTSHPFFQFVEALYSSGVTAGCGSGNYCPDAPLTRGQMAVFLAKALGLQWQ